MAKVRLKAYAFNGMEIYPEVEVSVSLGKDKDNYPINVYQTLKDRVKEELKIEPKFYIISKDIEKLQNNNIKLDYNDFIEKIYSILVEELQDYETEITNPLLQRALYLKNEKRDNDIKDILSQIDNTTLSKYELDEYNLLKFFVSEKKEEEFEIYKSFFNHNILKLKELYFLYIKKLEDDRNFKKSSKILTEFETIFPIDELTDSEKTYFYYLKGRNYYSIGEFLLALENLAKAKQYTGKDQQQILSDIYNTATNSFTDNLFFDEALELANRALKIRESLKLDKQRDETLSLIGGIYFKNSKYKYAYNYFKKALTERNKSSRLYNYLAKSAIMLGYKNAKDYIKESEKKDNENDFLVLIQILEAFQNNNLDKVIELYNEKFIKEIKSSEYEDIVKGWSHTFVALAYFQKGSFQTGIEYLYRALKFFIKDKYILEAYYVTLYLYLYEVPQKFIDSFNYLKESLNLDNLIDEYILKHKNIAENYCEIFDIKNSKKNNLLSFYEKTKFNKNSKELEKLMNQFTLF